MKTLKQLRRVLTAVVAGLSFAVVAPTQIEFMSNTIVTPIFKGYRPHVIIAWQPRFQRDFVRITGFYGPSLRLKKIGFWAAEPMCDIRITRGSYFSGPVHVWSGLPWPLQIHENAFPVELEIPGTYSVEYGNWFGQGCPTTRYLLYPEICVALFEVIL